MEHYLKELNSSSQAPMPLVMFGYALEHASRLCRILRQPGGHALLVGLGGSGRQSLARLAAHVVGYKVLQIEVSAAYGMAAWRGDLKKVLKMAGADAKQVFQTRARNVDMAPSVDNYSLQVVFLFNDMQIKDEGFLEDIGMILNTGEVPNLFAAEEKAEILERVQVPDQTPKTYCTIWGLQVHILFCTFALADDRHSRQPRSRRGGLLRQLVQPLSSKCQEKSAHHIVHVARGKFLQEQT